MIPCSSRLARRLLLPLALLLPALPVAGAKDFDDGQVSHIGYPRWFLDTLFLDLQGDLRKAAARGKQGLMVLFTTEGCSYCDAFIRRSLGDPAIAATVQRQFDSVGLEIFDDAEMTSPKGESLSVKAFASHHRAEFAPTLLFFGADGELLLRAVGYQSPERFRAILAYLAEPRHRTEPFAAFMLRRSQTSAGPPAGAGLKDDLLFSKPPYALDRRRFAASQPLLIVFEQAGCQECADFHAQVLALPEVRNTLKRFEIVRLDARDDTTRLLAPDGTRVTPAAWFRQAAFTRVPALWFFDENGNAVLKTDALVLRQRMMNSLNYMLERAYEKGWTYQQFARAKAIERSRARQQP